MLYVYIYMYTQQMLLSMYIYSLRHTLRTQSVFQIFFGVHLEHNSPTKLFTPNCSKCIT